MALTEQKLLAPSEWNTKEKILFRIAFLFFAGQAVPLDWKFYLQLANIDWPHFSYRDLFYLARYTPRFLGNAAGERYGIGNLADWAIVFVIAVAGGIAWSMYDRKTKTYDDAYYLLRVILRYRLALAVTAYGFIKFFPLQLPYPSLSLQQTLYGDLSDWKISSLTYGVAPLFESFLGIVEVLAGALLLNRKTASIGAAIVIGFEGNVLLSNLAFGGGESIYCLYLLTMAAVLVFFDMFRWHRVIVLAKPAFPNSYRPNFHASWKRVARILLKAAFVLVCCLYGYLSFQAASMGSYHYPQSSGLPNARGFYNVSEFRLNGRTLPYSLTDPVRWQNVVWEDWPTLSIRSNRELIADTLNTEEMFANDDQRIYESTGSKGRSFYRYTADTLSGLLYLQNKNRHYPGDRMLLHYSRPNSRQIILSGTNETNDSVYVVLDRLNKVSLLDESYKIPRKRSVFE